MRYYIIGLVLFSIDIVTKMKVQDYFSGIHIEKIIDIIPDIFTLQLQLNTGVAFSFPVPRFIQIFLTLAFFVFFFFWAKNNFVYLHASEKWGSVLLVTGAMGNFLERLFFSHVTDFLAFHFPYFGGFDFPVFNLADVFIFLGVCLWLFGATKKKSSQDLLA